MLGGRIKSRAATTLPAKIAKNAAELYIKDGQLLPRPPSLPGELSKPAACYVFIYEDPGQHLRASFGVPLPRQRSLAEEIIFNTSQAVAGIVRRADLSYLRYRVAVLGQPQRITQTEHLDPRLYGLYLQSERGKTAVILPGRTGIETADDQVATALRESGIDTRQETATMYRVPVTYYE